MFIRNSLHAKRSAHCFPWIFSFYLHHSVAVSNPFLRRRKLRLRRLKWLTWEHGPLMMQRLKSRPSFLFKCLACESDWTESWIVSQVCCSPRAMSWRLVSPVSPRLGLGPPPGNHAPNSALSQLVDCKRIQGVWYGHLHGRRARITEWQLSWPLGSHTHCPYAQTCPRPLWVLVLLTLCHSRTFHAGGLAVFPPITPISALHLYLWTAFVSDTQEAPCPQFLVWTRGWGLLSSIIKNSPVRTDRSSIFHPNSPCWGRKGHQPCCPQPRTLLLCAEVQGPGGE